MGNERAFSEGRAEPAVEPVGERLPLASLFTGKMKKISIPRRGGPAPPPTASAFACRLGFCDSPQRESNPASPGSAGVPPASGTCRRFRPRLRTRAQTTNILDTINRKQGLHPAKQWGKEPCAGLKNHSPLEGESATRAEPAVEPVGGPDTTLRE